MKWLKKLTKKKKNRNEFLALASGQIGPLSQAPDPAFSSLAMGDGIVIEPSGSDIVSPDDGQISMIFPTKHAFGVKTKDGIEILIHVGIDTVNLKGGGFTYKKKEHDKVKAGDIILQINQEKIKEKGYDPTIMVVITNPNNYKITFMNEGIVRADETVIGSYE